MEYDVKPIAQSPFGLSDIMNVRGDKPLPGAFARNRVQNRVQRYQRIAGQEKLCNQTRHKARTEQRKMDVRWPPRIGMIEPRIGAGLNGEKAILALFICETA